MEQNVSKRKVRPTLIVGVGGTGTKAIKMIKGLFQTLHPKHSNHPDAIHEPFPFIQFLAIDTDSEPEIGMPLNGDEFLHIGNFNFEQIFEDVRSQKGPYAYIDWLPKTNLGQIRRGVGGERRVGRLCYHRARHKILESIGIKLANLKATRTDRIARMNYSQIDIADESNSIDIHLISSVCGGTGSGFLLNIAYDLYQHTVKEIKVPPVIFAHLVLPEPFDLEVPPITRKQNRINAYITLNEIDHFIHHTNWKEKYVQDVIVEIEEQPFNYCFLLGDQGKETKKNIYEMINMISEAISLLTFGLEGECLMRTLVNLSTRLFVSKTQHLQKLQAYSTYGVSILEIPQQESDIFEICLKVVNNDRDETLIEQRKVLETFLIKFPQFKSNYFINEIKKLIDSSIDILKNISQLKIRSVSRRGIFPRKNNEEIQQKVKNEFKNLVDKYEEQFNAAFDNQLNHQKNELESFFNNFWEKDFSKFIKDYKISFTELKNLFNELNTFIKKELENIKSILDKEIKDGITIAEFNREKELNKIKPDVSSLRAAVENLYSLKAKEKSLEKVYKEQIDSFQQKLIDKKNKELYEFDRAISRIKYNKNYFKLDNSIRLPLKDINILEQDENTAREILKNFWRLIFSNIFDWKNGFFNSKQKEPSLAIRNIIYDQAKMILSRIHSREMNLIDILQKRDDVSTILENRFNDAAPAWRVKDNYLTQDLQRVSYINIDVSTEFRRIIDRISNREIKPTRQVNPYEIIFFRTEHGLALWGLETLADYFNQFERYRKNEEKTVAELQNDPKWKIDLVIPTEVSKNDVYRLFSAAWYLGRLSPDGDNNYYYREEIISIKLSQGRFDSFRVFQMEIATRQINYYKLEELIEKEIEKEIHTNKQPINLTPNEREKIYLSKEIEFYHNIFKKLRETISKINNVKDREQLEEEMKIINDLIKVKSDAFHAK